MEIREMKDPWKGGTSKRFYEYPQFMLDNYRDAKREGRKFPIYKR